MFDFEDNTYSGVLSILSCLLGMSYPLIVGCIEKIDSRLLKTEDIHPPKTGISVHFSGSLV